MRTWHFNKIDSSSNFKFNQSMEDFDKYGVSGVIRENIQNSSDARLDNEKTVLIKIELDSIKTKDVPGIECLKNRINALKGKSSYSKEFISNMQKVIAEDKCRIMTIEDANTKGLSGATESESSYVAYAYSKGFHAEDENEDNEAQRGGSHGIGKIASNAASDIATMYFATKDDKGKEYIGGTCEFIDHTYEGKNYIGTGNFATFSRNGFLPYENMNMNMFSKVTRGLKVIIPFVKEDFYNNKEIIKSICDSFFLSIINSNLSVKVGDIRIEKESFEDIISNPNYYSDQIKDYNRNSNLTPLYYKTYVKGVKVEVVVEDKNKTPYTFDIYISMNEDLKAGRYCVFRTNGMKVAENAIKGHASSPFNIVVVANSQNEDKYLKSLENEAHTQLSSVHIKDKKTKSNATRFLNNLNNIIKELVANRLEELNPTDGKMDTSDIIYELEHSFKESNRERKSTVKISEGKKKNSKKEDDVVLTKTSTGDYTVDEDGSLTMTTKTSREGSKSDDPKKTKESGTDEKKVEKTNPGKRSLTKEKNGQKKQYTKLSSGSAKRRVLVDSEKLYLNLSGISQLKKKTTCALKISVIDGEGIELSDFKVGDNYKEVTSGGSILKLSTDEREIEDVPINDGIINLSMKLAENYNKNLKFIYEVVI